MEVDFVIDCVFWFVVFSGVFIGIYEVLEFCDGDNKVFGGKGVFKVVDNINNVLVKKFVGFDIW